MNEYIYILSNRSMPGLLKIGFTSWEVRERSAKLFTTGVPDPFRIELILPVDTGRAFENKIHESLKLFRHNAEREFFKISLQEAIRIILSIYDSQAVSEPITREQSEDAQSTKGELTDLQRDIILLIASEHERGAYEYDIRGLYNGFNAGQHSLHQLLANKYIKKEANGRHILIANGYDYLEKIGMLDEGKIEDWKESKTKQHYPESFLDIGLLLPSEDE